MADRFSTWKAILPNSTEYFAWVKPRDTRSSCSRLKEEPRKEGAMEAPGALLVAKNSGDNSRETERKIVSGKGKEEERRRELERQKRMSKNSKYDGIGIHTVRDMGIAVL